MTEALILLAFLWTYGGMAIGGLPRLGVDRAWIAAAAAAALLVTGSVATGDAAGFLDGEALLLLLAMMLISAQLQFSGVYEALALRLQALADRPLHLLAAVIALGGGLSAVLVNDIVVFALAPLLVRALRPTGLAVTPYLLALACASNAGSAATLVGNPQNILIGQRGGLDFWAYTAFALPPSLLALGVVYLVVAWQWRGRWRVGAGDGTPPAHPAPIPRKPWIALALLLGLFATALPRELSALAVAVWVMASRHQPSRRYVEAVDWNLLILFAGLFVVTGAFSALPVVTEQAGWLGGVPESPWGLAALAMAGSNLIGNVPLVMALLSLWPETGPQTLSALALFSTLAGNLLLVGSVVNLIVAECARREGARLGFLDFARTGIPVTLISLTLAIGWVRWAPF